MSQCGKQTRVNGWGEPNLISSTSRNLSIWGAFPLYEWVWSLRSRPYFWPLLPLSSRADRCGMRAVVLGDISGWWWGLLVNYVSSVVAPTYSWFIRSIDRLWFTNTRNGCKMSATYSCAVCGMSVNATCAKCNKSLVNDSLALPDGGVVQISRCPECDGKIKSPMCCGSDMSCSI